MTNEQLASHLARYLHHRVTTPVDGSLRRPRGGAARLYGIEVCDTAGVEADEDGAARFLCLAVGPAYDVLDTFGPSIAERFDAVGLVVDGNAFEMDDLDRPSRRVTTTTVSLPDGIGSAITFHGVQRAAVQDRPIGELATALTSVWLPQDRRVA